MVYIKYKYLLYYVYAHTQFPMIKVVKKLLEIMDEVGDQFGKSVYPTSMYR